MEALVCFALAALFPRDEAVEDGEGGGAAVLPGLDELDLEAQVKKLRRESTGLFWFGIVAASVFFQLAPIVTVLRPWPAVFLTPEQLDRHANALASHRVYLVRQVMFLLKLVGGLFWGQSMQVRASIALPPYPLDPGTRRTEAQVARPVLQPRTPSAGLVQLGKREVARGRSEGSEHSETGNH